MVLTGLVQQVINNRHKTDVSADKNLRVVAEFDKAMTTFEPTG
jgi:hypothetical protein